MPSKKKVPVQTGQNNTTSVVMDDDIIDESTVDNIEDEILEEYGDIDSWTNISLSRSDPATGEYEFIKKYDSPPKRDIIAQMYGGGHYKLYLQWKPSSDGKRRFRKKIFRIAGESLNVTRGPVIPKNGTSEETAFFKHMDKMKEYGMINQNNSNSNNGENSLVSTLMKQNNDLMMKLIEVRTGGNGSDTTTATLVATLLKAALEKNDQLKTFLDFKSALDGATPGGTGPKEENVFKDYILPLVEPILDRIVGPGAAPASIGARPAGKNALEAPGGTKNPPGDIVVKLNEIIAILNQQSNSIMDLNKRSIAVETRLKELEDDYWIEAPGQEKDPGSPETGVISPIESINGKEQQQMDNEDPAVKYNLNLAKYVKSLPDDQKVNLLKEFIEKQGIKGTYDWCITYGAIDDLEGFNKYMKLAGEQDYIPE